MKRVSNRDAQPLITNRVPFTNAIVHRQGVYAPGNPRPASFRGQLEFTTRGHLPEEFLHPSLLAAVYVVYSYDTPLAWFHDDTWHYASIGYSPTTSKHQHIVRLAIADQNVVYHGGDWHRVPDAGKFWDGTPKVGSDAS